MPRWSEATALNAAAANPFHERYTAANQRRMLSVGKFACFRSPEDPFCCCAGTGQPIERKQANHRDVHVVRAGLVGST